MRAKPKSGALLTEMIVVLLIFTLCATVLVQLFSFALSLSGRAEASTAALSEAQNTADLLYTAADAAQALQNEGFWEGDGCFYKEEDTYTLRVSVETEPRDGGTMLTGTVEAVYNGETLVSLPLKKYTGGKHA